MRLSRSGIYRYHGPKSLFTDGDRCVFTFAPGAGSPKIQVRITADRSPQDSSYNYVLQLSPAKVVKCLLTLPPTSVADAIKELAGSFPLSKVVPEVIKHLAAGAIPANVSEDEDEDEDEDEEPDDDTNDEAEDA